MNEAIKFIDLVRSTSEGCYIIELSNSPDDSEASIARARVAPRVTTRWHRLAGTTERYIIIEGKGRVEVGSLPPQEVGPGDVVFIPPLCPQRITNLGRHGSGKRCTKTSMTDDGVGEHLLQAFRPAQLLLVT